jgi:hypothetical protein
MTQVIVNGKAARILADAARYYAGRLHGLHAEAFIVGDTDRAAALVNDLAYLASLISYLDEAGGSPAAPWRTAGAPVTDQTNQSP